jgi:hypothetical protein
MCVSQLLLLLLFAPPRSCFCWLPHHRYALLKSNQVDEASMTDLSRLVFKIIPYAFKIIPYA